MANAVKETRQKIGHKFRNVEIISDYFITEEAINCIIRENCSSVYKQVKNLPLVDNYQYLLIYDGTVIEILGIKLLTYQNYNIICIVDVK